ncbi:MAG: autotransporter outer membrane beta-barrel domain-containing protein [Candidatus Omnitrophota bacterium]
MAAPLLTYQGIREFQNLWLSRLDACGEVSWPSENKENCKDEDLVSGWWAKGFGYWGSQDARGAFTAYDARILGTMVAYDRSLGLNTRGGLGFGYSRSRIKGQTYDARVDFDTYSAVAYVGHERGPWFVDGSASFGWNEYVDKRHIEFTGIDRTAESKYSGQSYTAFGRTGFHFPIQKFTVTPMASLQYSRVNMDRHTEKGAGDVNLEVKSQQYDYLESGLGGKVERNFILSNNYMLVPEAHFEWLHKLSNPKLEQAAVYESGTKWITTPGLKTVADSYHAGIGLNLLSCACSATTWSLEAGYDYYWRTDGYAANQATVRFSRRF